MFTRRPHAACDHVRRTACARRGGIVLECFIAIPVLLIILLAIIEFGYLVANRGHVAFAARAGAEAASEGLSRDDVAKVVASQLGASNISACVVILEVAPHDGSVRTATDPRAACACGPPATSLEPAAEANADGVVRVTVCVPMSELTPDLLATFGFSNHNRILSASATFARE